MENQNTEQKNAQKQSLAGAIVKGILSGLAEALGVIVIRYLISGGNDGDFVSEYLFSWLGILCLVVFPIGSVVCMLIARNKKEDK